MNTERKQTEEALRLSEEKFSVLFHKAPFAVAVSRFKDAVFVDVNEAFLRMFGYSKDEVIGKTDVEINMIPDPDLRAAVLAELQSNHRLRQREVRMRSRNGRDYIGLLNADVVEIAGEPHLLAVCEDITERKKAEAALQRAQAQLREHANTLEKTVAERTAELKETNEQLEAFVYSIAHDLRSPLRAMEGFAQILLEDLEGKLPETEQVFLTNIERSAKYMDRMIQDLLAFGRTARTEITLHNVHVQKNWDAACFQCADQIQQTGAQIETVKPLPTVRAHDATLTQVLANLLNNAIKFMKPGTKPEIRFWAEDLGDSAKLWLQDNGIGIEAKHQERVFWVFERLHGANFAGTGIGLSIVRKGVERMGGQIGLQSEPGRGTRFWIELSKA